ncbi:hypothetical protein FB45DRAFT_1109325 [Roridomyces roridus]|uniref:DUF6535 domain-containing protein n=1 Tax=Roridomyces roridus TaxID=1738132 RepID=A0AAD7BAV4_9AGAR|nr:hypothetical protein FB45DRAFT_1109325 [Roridomyces roridus]
MTRGDPKYTDESAATKLWAVYVSEAEKYDKALVKSWKADMDGLLIFAGLFSASLTAFLIESYATLMPDEGEATIAILMQISRQITAGSSGNSSSFAPELPNFDDFQPSTASLACNTLWFLSLGLSLSCALMATLVEQWARDFIQRTDMRPSPPIRARIFSYLYYGLRRFRMHSVVELVPLLLHISVALFFAGLIPFLYPVNKAVMGVCAFVLLVIVGGYAGLTVLPILYSDCPYRTPLSSLARYIWMCGERADRLDPRGPGSFGSEKSRSLTDVMTRDAVKESPQRSERDSRALVWTMKSLTADSELEPLIEALPDIVWDGRGPRELYRDQVQALLNPSARLLPRIEDLLRSCEGGPIVAQSLRERRQVACLKAIWAIAHLEPVNPDEPFYGFDFDLLVPTTKFSPAVQRYLVSAMAIARFNFADWYERERQRVRALVDGCRDQLSDSTAVIPLHILPGIAADFERLERQSAAAVGRFEPDADYWEYRLQFPAVWMANTRGQTISLSSSRSEVRHWLDHASVALKSRGASRLKIFCSFIQAVSDLEFPPYELESTCRAMTAGSSWDRPLAKKDLGMLESALRYITSPAHLSRLKAHLGMHHIDTILAIMVSFWQAHMHNGHGVQDSTSEAFAECLLRYIGVRGTDETLMGAFQDCDHHIISSALSAHFQRRWCPAEDFKLLWRWCAFYCSFSKRRSPQDGAYRATFRLPTGFDGNTVLAVETGAPPDIAPSVLALLGLLMIRTSAPSSHAIESPAGTGLIEWRSAMEWRRSTYWLALTEFMERCAAAAALPVYRANETLDCILAEETWYPQKVTSGLQRRFAEGFTGLVTQDGSTHTHAVMINLLVRSFVFKWYTPEPIAQSSFKFDDPEAGRIVREALERFVGGLEGGEAGLGDGLHEARIIAENLRKQEERVDSSSLSGLLGE